MVQLFAVDKTTGLLKAVKVNDNGELLVETNTTISSDIAAIKADIAAIKAILDN